MCICRPNWEMGKALGYLKGDLTGKMSTVARRYSTFLNSEVKKTGSNDRRDRSGNTDHADQFHSGAQPEQEISDVDEAQTFNREEAKAFIAAPARERKWSLPATSPRSSIRISICSRADCRMSSSECRARNISACLHLKEASGLLGTARRGSLVRNVRQPGPQFTRAFFIHLLSSFY